MLIKIVCPSEGNSTVGIVETPDGSLDASLVRTMKSRDHKRAPLENHIQNGVQMSCRRCKGALYFEAADGKRFPANPGTVQAVK
jgi:hypothetical protein